MAEFIPGQRWINDAQLQMGLGTVLSTDFRTVTLFFLAAEETVVYAKESVPLTRVRFAAGDSILTADEQCYEVIDASENDGLIVYQAKTSDGSVQSIAESELSYLTQLNRPAERLFNGQVDRDSWFDLRYRTQQRRADVTQNALRGLAGGRVDLIPHQLYIANEVANRYAPRVLLADEVGLGKTIEAGMILHHQLVTERARRVLIVVPESLVHQWLIEMLRRFNLHFKIFDAERIDALTSTEEFDDLDIIDQVEASNPFHSEQLVLCSLEFLYSRPDYYKQCRDGDWDLLVVDEAHHLEWSEEDPGFEYQLIEQLAQKIKGILLLTATPEQLGKSSHFARLRLLDPQRFPSYAQFVEEENQYQPIADVVEKLLDTQSTLSTEDASLLDFILGSGCQQEIAIITDSTAQPDSRAIAVNTVVEGLVDRHGTGRVLFRNTRSVVKGFPAREVHHYSLPLPDAYRDTFAEIAGAELSEMQLLLCPELLYQAISDSPAWTSVDPRVAQLGQILQQHRQEKILVITASADSALDLSTWLRVSKGINAAVFHEGMSLVERDRAAAFFADRISGTQVLICSEIGSEGRNFQFSHHLVLFDLPLNPDLLEQRIGRLDRIGQTGTIHLHVLFIENTAQEIMYHWYHSGLQAFTRTCPVGHAVFTKMRDSVTAALHFPNRDYQSLISTSADHFHRLTEALQQGRDRLLEFNSCRPEEAQKLRQLAQQQDVSESLPDYMALLFDCVGVEYEMHSEGCFAVNPGSHMTMALPHLPEDGMTVTYSRDIALGYEDVSYLSWDHPLVTGAMDMLYSGETGNTSVIAAPVEGAARGTILLESIFILESASSESLHSGRYLPPTTIRTFIDQTGKRFDRLPPISTIADGVERLRPEMIRRILAAREKLLRKMVAASEKFANRLAPKILEQAVEKSRQTIEKEISRLQALLEVNPNVRQEEIEFYRQQLTGLTARLEQSRVRLDALRVVIAT